MRKVLIADDSLDSRRILSFLVRKTGCSPLEASDGQEALQLARRELPDLVLLDVKMPCMDGYQVCAALKSDPLLKDIPVMLISAHVAPADKIKGLNLGAADYVTIPFDFDEVQARIRTQIRLRQLNRSLVLLNRELTQKQLRLEEDLRAAADIQRALLPRGRHDFPGVEVAWRFVPCGSVGGDIFNVQMLDDEHLAAYMLDVTGHGVPPAMVTVSVAQMLSPGSGLVVDPRRATAQPVAPPRDVLDLLDREYPFGRSGRFFTISYLVLDTRTGLLRYSSAGHPPPLLLRAGGALETLSEGGPPIGLQLDPSVTYEEGCVHLERGDKLLLYTDGVVDRMDPQGEPFGLSRLRALLAERGRSLDTICDQILGALSTHGHGAPQDDDISFLALQYQEASSQEST